MCSNTSFTTDWLWKLNMSVPVSSSEKKKDSDNIYLTFYVKIKWIFRSIIFNKTNKKASKKDSKYVACQNNL